MRGTFVIILFLLTIKSFSQQQVFECKSVKRGEAVYSIHIAESSIYVGTKYHGIISIDSKGGVKRIDTLNKVIENVKFANNTLYYSFRRKKISCGKKVIDISTIKKFDDIKINDIEVDMNNIWVATNHGLLLFDTSLNPQNIDLPDLGNININDIHIDNQKNKWFATSKGICELAFGKNNQDLKSENIIKIISKDNVIFACSRKSVFIKQGRRDFQEIKSLPQLTIFDINIDSFNNLWIGGVEQVLKYSVGRDTFLCFSKNSGLKGKTNHTIAFDNLNRTWVGTPGSGIFIIDEGAEKRKQDLCLTNLKLYNDSAKEKQTIDSCTPKLKEINTEINRFQNYKQQPSDTIEYDTHKILTCLRGKKSKLEKSLQSINEQNRLILSKQKSISNLYKHSENDTIHACDSVEKAKNLLNEIKDCREKINIEHSAICKIDYKICIKNNTKEKRKVVANIAKKLESGEQTRLENFKYESTKAVLKSDLRDKANKDIEIIAKLLKGKLDSVIELTGHVQTKKEKQEAANSISLSKARVLMLRDKLIEKGCKPNQIVCFGYAGLYPDNTDRSERDKRVEGKIMHRDSLKSLSTYKNQNAKYKLIDAYSKIGIKDSVIAVEKLKSNHFLYKRIVKEKNKVFFHTNDTFRETTFKGDTTSIEVKKVYTNYIVFKKSLWINGRCLSPNESEHIITITKAGIAYGRVEPRTAAPYFSRLLFTNNSFKYHEKVEVEVKVKGKTNKQTWYKIVLYGYQRITN